MTLKDIKLKKFSIGLHELQNEKPPFNLCLIYTHVTEHAACINYCDFIV